ncbi:PAS domain S-box-containing protein [Streptomyces sp. yr375]|uniref:PP2C family protein-serine/threonine phosphatase n=1 Tax=Streptomyces sp. yr375 TaxID=1761906 RepID=UPI0008BDB0D6|nr:PP2C family protein-serine/threonine phosphatase [Streptomyces sp. yr375]SES23127.1 PAS domain S-box-containing protein [Streptomyces sp. yr375]
MPPHVSADRSAAPPPGRGPVDALITQTRRLKGDMDAVRQDAQGDTADPQGRWQRALCDLALHQLDDLDTHLAQLRDGPPPVPAAPATARRGALLSRVGTAEWNLLTDGAVWSEELYRILGRDLAAPPLTLDELPSLVLDEDRPKLTAMVTDCLVDARPIDGEFRVVRPGGEVRTVHMMGEPVLDGDGGTAAMWAVVRDVSELRRSQRAVRESRDSLQHERHRAQTEHRLAVELREAVLPPWHGSPHLAHQGPGPRPLDVAAHYLPAATTSLIGGDWYDALELADGHTLLSVGDLTGHGPAVSSNTAMLLGALRGMAMAGTQPAQLLSWLNQLLDAAAQPSLGSAVCCRYRPDTRTLSWARAGHPSPLLFRDGTGRRLTAPEGVLLGAGSRAAYGQAEATLEEGDLLLLHTDALAPVDRLLGLAPRLHGARTAQDCVRMVVAECGESAREDDACVLVARVTC